LFTVCLRCNESLQEASPDQVRPLIPDYVFQTQKSFRVCPKCRGVFWSGTHRERAMKTLEKLLGDTMKE
ncbi:MAG: Mut7-C RNAse domain-containing protein, partial [Syntrophaceae bacterium]